MKKNNINNITDTYIPPKDVADDYLKLSVFALNKGRCLRDGASGRVTFTSHLESILEIDYSVGIDFIYGEKSYIRLKYVDYDFNGNEISVDLNIFLTTTLCTYGGERYWFICPAVVNGKPCNRRVGVLYKPKLGCPYFGCRHCYDLTYESSKVSGNMKQYGVPVSIPELESLRKQVKKKFYKGEFTKRFAKYLIKLDQFEAYHNAWRDNFYSKYLKK